MLARVLQKFGAAHGNVRALRFPSEAAKVPGKVLKLSCPSRAAAARTVYRAGDLDNFFPEYQLTPSIGGSCRN
jgi:hypothetical protein